MIDNKRVDKMEYEKNHEEFIAGIKYALDFLFGHLPDEVIHPIEKLILDTLEDE